MAAGVMALLMGGVLAMLIQSRRLTEGSVFQNSTVAIMQGYLEQLKNMEYGQLVCSPATTPASPITLPTLLDQSTPDPLTLSIGSPPTTMPPLGTTPSGAVDNIKVSPTTTGYPAPLGIDINNTPGNPNDDLRLNIWIWVQDLTGTATDVTNSKSITMIYTWGFPDGGRLRSYRGSVRTMRSVVPSY